MTDRPLRIALLAHSTNPRGGVVHAIELAEALNRLGHDAVVHAPGRAGTSFFRPVAAGTVIVPASGSEGGLFARVEAGIADYVRHFSTAAHRRFDIFHAGDGLSANALAQLRQAGLIGAYARTVHHLDDFADHRLTALDRQSAASADALLTVSELTATEIRHQLGRRAIVVGNGVNPRIFSMQADGGDRELVALLGQSHPHRQGPVFLSVGGVEARKNSRTALAAFVRFRESRPEARWIVAGGASLLDHSDYRRAFEADLAASGLPDGAVTLLGPVPQSVMPALYRLADALLFPSRLEGFGLAVLEAMACGTPAIVPRDTPFTTYLGSADAAWCDAHAPASIAEAMALAVHPASRSRLVINGFAAADRHSWDAVAAAHLPVYEHLREHAHA